jgi:hypothetical protein
MVPNIELFDHIQLSGLKLQFMARLKGLNTYSLGGPRTNIAAWLFPWPLGPFGSSGPTGLKVTAKLFVVFLKYKQNN